MSCHNEPCCAGLHVNRVKKAVHCILPPMLAVASVGPWLPVPVYGRTAGVQGLRDDGLTAFLSILL